MKRLLARHRRAVLRTRVERLRIAYEVAQRDYGLAMGNIEHSYDLTVALRWEWDAARRAWDQARLELHRATVSL